MARSRALQLGRLKAVDRWDLGLILALLFVGCVAVGVIYKRQSGNALLLAKGTFYPRASAVESAPSLAVQALQNSPAAVAMQTPKLDVIYSPAVVAPAIIPAAAPAIQAFQKPGAELRPQPEVTPKEVTWFHGQKFVYWKSLRMKVTAYAPDKRCCWPFEGTTTASGASVKTNHGRLVAADTRLIPFGCLVSVPDYHNATPVPVLDRGGAIKGRRLDVLMPTYAGAQQWGNREVLVKVYKPVDDQ